MGITTSLVGTHAATSVLGLVFWTLATRQFTVAAVGVAGAAVALMGLLASLGTLGLGTLLIARIPHTPQGSRRVLVRTSLVAAGAATAVVAVVVPVVTIHVFGAENLRPVAGTVPQASLFAVGTALMAVAMVIDQAVLVIGSGSLQLERNVVASATKVVVLAGLGLSGVDGGMTIFAAWTVGTLVSLPWVSWRTRGGRPLQDRRQLVHLGALRGLGRTALSHHALNTTLQAPLLLLPLLVTVVLSAADNGIFSAALQITGLVFALPYAVTVSLFAVAEGDEHAVASKMRHTIPFGLGVSVLANLALLPLAPLVLSVFGDVYSTDGADVLRLLALAGVPFVIKDHFVALRRVQGRTGEATLVLGAFLALELGAAFVGARVAGTEGMCVGWLAVLGVEAVALGAVLVRDARTRRRSSATPAVATVLPAPARADVSVAELVPGRTMTSLAAPPVTRRSAAPRRWHRGPRIGAAPAVALMAAGLCCMALAARSGRAESPSSIALWVAGLVLVFLPAAVVVLLPSTPGRQRVLLAVLMPLALQMSRFLIYPDRFAFHDELIHANVLRQIIQTGDLFSDNPLLPVTGYYPGMEVATAAVVSVTGLGQHLSSVVVLLAVRVVLSLSIIALVRRLTSSTRIAAAASIIYVCNPQWLFFNSQFSYQTFALPLAVMTLYLVAARRRGSALSLLLPLASLVVVTASHHVTGGLLVVALGVWTALELLLVRRRDSQVGVLAALTTVGAASLLAGLLNPGNTLTSYLTSIAGSSAGDVEQLRDTGKAKPLFTNSAGIGSELWEQVLMVVAVVVVTGVLLPALWRALAWLRVRSSLAVLLCLTACLWPLVPGGHLTRATAEVGDRAAGFAFLGVAFVLGWWLWQRRLGAAGALFAALTATVVFLGMVVLGAGPLAGQLPGAYRVSADARSVDPYNVSAARWMASELPPDTRVYGDRVGGLLAAAVGHQYTVRHISTDIDASRLLLDPEFTQADVDLVRRAGIQYVIADRRNANGLPNQDVYIESGEFGGDARTTPVPAEALRKFDAVPGTDRVYDNGAVVIYDVGVLRSAG